MRIYKNKDITTSIDTEEMSINNSDTYFYTEDKGSAALRIFINHRKTTFNLDNTDLTPVLDLLHSDGSVWLDEPLEVIMSDKGILQYNIPNNIITHAGQIKAKLFLKNTEQSVHVANFTFDIKDSGIEGAVEKEISVNLVDDAVRRIVKENAIEILGDGFEQRLNTDVINHLDSNPELFKGDKGDINTTVYTINVDMQSPFEGKKLFISYNQLMVSIMLQGNADGKVDNIKSTDVLIAKLPDSVPMPNTEFVRGTITSMTGGEAVQYIGNIFMDNQRNIYVKFNKNASGVTSYFGGSMSYPIGEDVVNFNKGGVEAFKFDNPSFLSMQGTDYFENYIFSATNEQKGDVQNIKYINTLDTNDKGTFTNLDSNFSSLVGHANSLKVLGRIGEEILIYVVKTDTPDIIPVYVNMTNKTTRVGTGIITIKDENASIKRIISINSINQINNEYVFDVYWYGINFNFKIDVLNIDIPTSVISTRTFEISESEISKIRKSKIGDFGNNVRTTQGTRIYDNHFYLTQYSGVTSSVFKFEIINDKLEYRNHWVTTKGNLDRFEIQDIFKIEGKIYIAISEQTLTGKYNNYITQITI